MKKVVYSLLLLALSFSVKAQVYSNEWINYSNKYFKFQIAKTGFYRIDAFTLASSGIPLASINPKNFQLFIKGKEQSIYIKGEADNVFDPGDYIEFFAEKNDGSFDSTMYYNISYLPNRYVSLFNDTISGFITWNNSTTNKRLILETDTASALYTPKPYFYTDNINTSRGAYNYVEDQYSNASDSRYTQAEGLGIGLNKGSLSNTGITTLNMYTAAALPVYIKINLSGASIDNTVAKDHELKGVIYNGASAPVTLFDTIFSGYVPLKYSFSVLSNTLGNASNIEVSSISNSIFTGVSNFSVLHYIYYKYPQLPTCAGLSSYKLFIDDDISFPKSYLKLTSVNTGTTNTVLFYDITNKKRIATVINSGNTKILVPNSGGQKLCYLSAESDVINIPKLYPVNSSGFFVNYKSPLADSAFVIITHTKLLTEANQYKSYRQSLAGGSHYVILANIDDLYDQFGYGISKHPLCIKNFCHYLIDSLPSPPKNLFVIGKAVQHRELLTEPGAWGRCLIPAMGVAPSDNLLTSAIKTNNWITPEIPIGRLAAQIPSDVTAYLNKVIVHEQPASSSASGSEWRKHVLHFAGGTDINQQLLFQAYLGNYKAVIEDTLYGGKVYDFKKTTTAPIQITISDSVKNHFNNGVGLVCFFGHGSYSGFDQAIDDPNVYNNANKYPFMIANSCFSGNIHTFNVASSSERFVLINQKGTIGFLAAASLGFVSNLNKYTQDVYDDISKYKYNKSIGEIVKDVCYKSSLTSDNIQYLTALDMTLHGDPAVKISVGRLPDYYIDNSSVSFDTKKYVDSVGISVDITNLGEAIKDSIIVRIERYFPNNDSMTFFKKIKAPLYKSLLKFYTLIDYTRGIGLNKFKVYVDAYNGVTELYETNNSTTGTVDIFIQGGDIVPVYPYKYDIIPKTPTVTLKASTSDPFASARNYKLQLDTCDAFTSPIQTTLIQSTGGVVEWTVNLPFADSTVYYWRVSKDSTGPGNTYVWRESSFQVIGNKHGWGQAHFFQFKNDGYQFVKFKRPSRRFEFENDVTSLDVRTGFLSAIAFDQITYSLNGSVKHTWNCGWNGWTIAVFDSITGKPWIANAGQTVAGPGVWGNCNCVPSAQALSAYDFGGANYCSIPTWQPELLTFLNAIPPNNHVLAYSAQNHNSSSFSAPLQNAFKSFGSAQIMNVKDTVPIIIFGWKGLASGLAHEVVGANNSSIINLTDSIKTRWNNGYIASEIIGPSYKWNSLHWKLGTLDVSGGDTTVLKVVGIKVNGQRDTLVTFTKDSLNVLDLYNYVSSSTYPYLQLVALMKDNVNRTSPQLKRWQVLYDEAPECAINPKKGFKVLNDTLQEGDNVIFYLPVENVGTVPFTDSLVFTYYIEDANRVMHPLPQKLKAKPFNPAAVIIDTLKINSYQYPGNNALWIDINPPQNSRYQFEQYHFNNVARYAFEVSRDITNPLLNVTFDGVRIMNGDVVSAKPNILVSLKDENKFLVLNDTGAFTVYLKKPTDTQEQRIYFGNGLQFTPAQLPSNSAKIAYNPALAIDGKYLLIVQAKDRSNNVSGAVDYRITFEVVNKPSITQIINYPNPFSTSTRFVFNLTGSEVPEMFNIQIMTITGKIVKTIMRDELGMLHIGRNITEYAWDGKDDFGDKLANGVYLYKVQTKLNGQSIEHQSSEADQYFTKEIGKMVIMR